jgi:hypothetical protein
MEEYVRVSLGRDMLLYCSLGLNIGFLLGLTVL